MGRDRKVFIGNINIENAEYYGYEAQKDQCIEECSELIQALNKYSRACGKGKPTKMTKEEALANVIEEIADVEVMLEQMVHLLGIKRYDISLVKVEKIRNTRNEIEREKYEQLGK